MIARVAGSWSDRSPPGSLVVENSQPVASGIFISTVPEKCRTAWLLLSRGPSHIDSTKCGCAGDDCRHIFLPGYNILLHMCLLSGPGVTLALEVKAGHRRHSHTYASSVRTLPLFFCQWSCPPVGAGRCLDNGGPRMGTSGKRVCSMSCRCRGWATRKGWPGKTQPHLQACTTRLDTG